MSEIVSEQITGQSLYVVFCKKYYTSFSKLAEVKFRYTGMMVLGTKRLWCCNLWQLPGWQYLNALLNTLEFF